MHNPPFIFGAQYYRAPTPEKECWEQDLARMKELGFNAVKFWVQWRWSHRGENRFYFDDLDQLMDIARKNDLPVTLNVIFDVAPLWLYDRYPDAMQVTNAGTLVRPQAESYRQTGGFPGPCYNHPGALAERQAFMEETLRHFSDHPALSMWDVWNEPEQCSIYRRPEVDKLVCYCPNCADGFIQWLQGKYSSVDKLNEIWGRCYDDWKQVELPRSPTTFADFIDFREFHLDTMTQEAKWRLAMAKDLDDKHIIYLHVVPNTLRIFNSLTGVDDFALAGDGDVFGSTTFAPPIWSLMTVSAGRGKVCYNAECHLATGSIQMHQKAVFIDDILKDFLPQIGMGIRGFLFWQYRPEVLGAESPAWGLVKLDGSNRPLTDAAQLFFEKISPLADMLMQVGNPEPSVGIWLSRKNEIFHFCSHLKTDTLADSLDAYVDNLYWGNYPSRVINSEMLEHADLQGIRLLIMPSCYYLTEGEAQSLDTWVRSGGTLLCEAHLGGYNATIGRHARAVPGCRLADLWSIREVDSTSSYHLKVDQEQHAKPDDLTGDVKKAIETYGVPNGKHFPIHLPDGSTLAGANRFAELAADGGEVLGSFDGKPCIVKHKVGAGTVVYCGTNLGEGAHKDISGFRKFLDDVCGLAGVKPTLGCEQSTQAAVHVDLLSQDADPRALVIYNRSEQPQVIRLQGEGLFTGVFSGMTIDLGNAVDVPGNMVDLFVRDC